MTYELIFTDQAKKDIADLKKSDSMAFKKLKNLLIELSNHPYTGTGRPKLMQYKYSGFYSRRITQKHRIVYSINDNEISVLIVSSKGHYDDK